MSSVDGAKPPPPPPPPEGNEEEIVEEEAEEVIEEEGEQISDLGGVVTTNSGEAAAPTLTWGAPALPAVKDSGKGKGRSHSLDTDIRWKPAAEKLLASFEKDPNAVQYLVPEKNWDSAAAATNEKPRAISLVKALLKSGMIKDADQFIYEMREVFLNALRFYVGSANMPTRKTAYALLDSLLVKAEKADPPLVDSNKPRLDSEQKRKCRSAIDKVLNKANGDDVPSFFFVRDPTSYGGDDIEEMKRFEKDYKKYIVTPMWLGKVMTKLEHDEYQGMDELAEDVHLIFQNSSDFGQQEIVEQAKVCLKAFDDEMARYGLPPYTLVVDDSTAKERLAKKGFDNPDIAIGAEARKKLHARQSKQRSTVGAKSDDVWGAPKSAPPSIKTKMAPLAADSKKRGRDEPSEKVRKRSKSLDKGSKSKKGTLNKKRRKRGDDDDDDEESDEESSKGEEEFDDAASVEEPSHSASKELEPSAIKINDKLRKVLETRIGNILEKSSFRFLGVAINEKQHPNYRKIVKNPMWFGLLKERLQPGHKMPIKTLQEFLDLGKLIFANSYEYNQGNDEVIKHTKQCEALFDKMMGEVLEKERQSRQGKSGGDDSASKKKASPAAGPIKVSLPAKKPASTLPSLSLPVASGTKGPVNPTMQTNPESSPLRVNVDYNQKIEPKLRTKLLEVLEQMMKRKEARPFNQPVPWKEWGWKEYPEICPVPMDLGTVLHALNTSTKYQKLGDMIDDVALIWRNCRAFNQIEDAALPVLTYSSLLEKLFKENVEATVKKYHIAKAQEALRGVSPVPGGSATSSINTPAASPQPKPLVSPVSPPLSSPGTTVQPPTAAASSAGASNVKALPPALKPFTAASGAPSVVLKKPVAGKEPTPQSLVVPKTSVVPREPSPGLPLTIKARVPTQPVAAKAPPVFTFKVPESRPIDSSHCRDVDFLTFKIPNKSEFGLNSHEDAIFNCLKTFASVEQAKKNFGVPVLDKFGGDPAFAEAYTATVSQPMDLETLFIRLSRKEYKDPVEGPARFNADAQLIFTNSLAFNHNDPDLLEITRHFKEFWDDCFHEYLGPEEERKERAAKREAAVLETDATRSKTQTLIKKIISNKKGSDAEPFMYPVRHTPFYLADYPLIVKEPRDLGTINRKCDRDEYSTYGEFVRDIRLVFSNALLYNRAENPDNKVIRDQAMRMSELFESEWRKATLPIYEAYQRKQMEERKKRELQGDDYVEPAPPRSKSSSRHLDDGFISEEDDDDEEAEVPDDDDDDEESGGSRNRSKKRKRVTSGGDERDYAAPKRRSVSRRTSSGGYGIPSSPGVSHSSYSAPMSSPNASMGEDSQVVQFERETEIQVAARQELLRKYRLDQRKKRAELQELRKGAYGALIKNVKHLALTRAEHTAERDVEKKKQIAHVLERLGGEKDTADEKKELSGTEVSEAVTEIISTAPLVISSLNGNRTIHKKSTPPLPTVFSLPPPSYPQIESDLKSTTTRTTSDDGNVQATMDKTEQDRGANGEEVSLELEDAIWRISSDDKDEELQVLSLSAESWGTVKMWTVMVTLASEEDIAALEHKTPAGMMSFGRTQGEDPDAKLQIVMRKHKALLGDDLYRGREQDLSDAIASVAMSDYAPQLHWYRDLDTGLIVSTPYDELIQGQACSCVSFITPVTNDDDENVFIKLGEKRTEGHIEG